MGHCDIGSVEEKWKNKGGKRKREEKFHFGVVNG